MLSACCSMRELCCRFLLGLYAIYLHCASANVDPLCLYLPWHTRAFTCGQMFTWMHVGSACLAFLIFSTLRWVEEVSNFLCACTGRTLIHLPVLNQYILCKVVFTRQPPWAASSDDLKHILSPDLHDIVNLCDLRYCLTCWSVTPMLRLIIMLCYK